MSGNWWKGASDIQGNLQGVRERKNAGAVKGAKLAALNVLNVSNQQAPHEDGDLERDGAVSAEATKDGAVAAIAYGRTAQTKDYAVVQHEDMTLKHDPGRNAKYLENALNSTRAQSLEIMAEATKREIGT